MQLWFLHYINIVSRKQENKNFQQGSQKGLVKTTNVVYFMIKIKLKIENKIWVGLLFNYVM